MSKEATPIRIIVAEDQAVVRSGLVAIFKHIPDIEVVGEAQNGLEALSLFEELKPQVVLMDLVMPVMGGLATIPKLLEIDPKARILIVTGFGDADNVYQAIIQGASGVILKDSTYEQLLEAVYAVSRGEEFLPASIAMRIFRERLQMTESQKPEPEELEPEEPEAPEDDQKLTNRELDTLRGIAQGMSNQEIAEKLFLQERTVSKYTSTILKKLQLENRTQAAIYALRKGISELDPDDEEEQ
jgi:DNA-binding NarL/FixJ family response regulator